MANHDLPILGPNLIPDTTVFQDLVGNQITAAASPSVGDQQAYVLTDGGADAGIYCSFSIPQNYVGTPVLVIKGIIDGAPGATDTLGFGFRKRAVADNEAADGTYDAEQTASATIGSSGSNHANEDLYLETIALTAANYAVADTVFYYFYIDTSGTTFTGNFLLTDLIFRYADA